MRKGGTRGENCETRGECVGTGEGETKTEDLDVTDLDCRGIELTDCMYH